MKKLTFGFIVILSLISFSCHKDTIDPGIDELEIFKNQTGYRFTGTVLGNEINWKFDNWENGIGANYGIWNVNNDTTLRQVSFAIYDAKKRYSIELLDIKSPAFSYDDSYEHKKSLFDTGLKDFHSSTSTIYEGFDILVKTENNVYESAFGDQKGSTFNIIKVEELAPDASAYLPARLRLWIVISCNLYDGYGQKAGEIKEGKIVTEISFETLK